jgi:hypothetical protein
VRESEDILNTVKDMPYKFYSASKSSILVRFDGGEYKPLSELSKKGKELEINLVPKTEALPAIKAKFVQLLEELKKMDGRLGWQAPGMMQTKAYQMILNSYDVVQQFREVRTGDYNYPLMKHVIKNNIRWISEALGLPYTQRDYGCSEKDLDNETNEQAKRHT